LQQRTLSVLFNRPSGFFAHFHSHLTEQDNRGYPPALPGDGFWQHDVIAGYRFTKRRVEVRVGVLNLTDQDYHLNPLNLYAELPRHRTFIAAAKFNF